MGQIGKGLWFDLRLDDAEFQKQLADLKRQVEELNAHLHIEVDASGAIGGAREFNVTLGKVGASVNDAQKEVNRLTDAFLNLFTMDMAKNFLTQIVQIGGEIQKQRIAMGSILGDAYEAKEIYGQIKQLAVQSPFGVGDLINYTKRLTAYGIEYSDLYETMKRLADISAGVGIDMGRLTLAFGQTKSRTWLDAKELRQFAYAGIPLLQKLAEYYHEIEGMDVSTSNVRDRITKREVSFDDVKNVLWKMTDIGGQFYNMQEVMADSLAAKWKNLGDAWDVMMADMADSAVGDLLKDVAETATNLTRSWKTLLPTLQAVAASMALMKINSLGVASALKVQNGESTKMFMKRRAELQTIAERALAQKQEIAYNLEQISKNRALSASEMELIATRKQLTQADVQSLIFKERITAAEGQYFLGLSRTSLAMGKIRNAHIADMLVQGQLQAAQAKRLVLTQQITYQESLAVGKVLGWNKAMTTLMYTFGGMGQALKSFGASIAAFAFNPAMLMMTAVAAATSLWAHENQKATEMEEQANLMRQKSAEGLKALNEELRNHSGFDAQSASATELSNKIKSLKDTLKEYDAEWTSIESNIFKVDEASNKYVNDSLTQYKMLEERLKTLTAAYEDLGKAAEAFGVANEKTNGWFDESMLTNLADMNKDISTAFGSNLAKDSVSYNYNAIRDAIRAHAMSLGLEDADKMELEPLIVRLVEAGQTADRLKEVVGKGGKYQEAAKAVAQYVNDIVGGIDTASKDINGFIPAMKNALRAKGIDLYTDEARITARMQIDAVLNDKGITGYAKDLLLRRAVEADLIAEVKPVIKKGDAKSFETAYQQALFDKSGLSNSSNNWLAEILSQSTVVTEIDAKIIDAQKKAKEIMAAKQAAVDKIDRENADGAQKDILDAYDNAKERLTILEDLVKTFNIVDLSVKPTTTRNQRDDELKTARNEYEQFAKLYSMYKTLLKDYDELASFSQLKLSDTWSTVFGNKDEGPENIAAFVEYFGHYMDKAKELVDKAATDYQKEGRLNFAALIEGAWTNANSDQMQKTAEELLAQVQKSMTEAKENADWNKTMFEATGLARYAENYVDMLTTLIKSKLKDKSVGIGDLQGMSDSQLLGVVNANEFKAVKALLKEYSSAVKAHNKEVMDDYLKVYTAVQTAQEKLITLTNTWETKINKGLADGTIKSGEQLAIMWKAASKEIGNATLDALKAGDNPIGELFSEEVNKNSIRFAKSMKEIRKLLDYINGKSKNKPEWINDDDIDKLAKSPEAVAELTDKLDDLETVWDKLGNSGLGGLIGGIGNMFVHATRAKAAREKMKEYVEGSDEYNKALEKARNEEAKFASGALTAFGGVGDVISDVGSQLDRLAEISGNARLKDLAQDLKDVGSIVSSTAQGAATGGWVGAIVGFVTSTTSAITNSVIQSKVMAEQYKQYMRDWANSLELMEVKLNKDKFESFFGTDKLNYAIEAYDKMIAAAEKYNSILGDRSNLDFWEGITRNGKKVFESLKYANDLQGRLVKTGQSGWWLWKDNEYKRLFDIAPELWDNKIDGAFNVENAKEFLKVNKQIDDTLRADIQHLIDLEEATQEAKDAMHDLLGEWYGSWSNTLTDAIFDGILNGTSAWDAFEKSGAEAVLSIGKTMLNSVVFSSFFKDYEDRLTAAFGSGSASDVTGEILSITADMYHALPNAFNAANEMAESYIKAAEEYGFNFDSLKNQQESSGLSTSIKGVTEDTADLLAAYLNAIRADVSVEREEAGQLNVIAESQLAQLNMIAENTRRNAEYALICADASESIRDTMNDVVNGTKKFYIQ